MKQAVQLVLGFFTFLIVLASAGIQTYFAINLYDRGAPQRILALAASVCSIVAAGGLLAIQAILTFGFQNSNGRLNKSKVIVAVTLGIIPACAAAALALASLLLNANVRFMRHSESLVIAEYGLWGLSVAFQFIYYAFALLTEPTSIRKTYAISPPRPYHQPENREPSPPTRLRHLGQQSERLGSPIPRTLTAKADPINAFKTSFRPGQRSLSSSRLVGSRSSLRPASNSVHSTRLSADGSEHSRDGFDMWDTASVRSQSRHIHAGAGLREPRLETIPGSRSSMAEPSPVHQPRRVPSVETVRRYQPYRIGSSSSTTSTERMSRQPSGESSRPASVRLDESYIHPLFRHTMTPTPPPPISPDSVITAHPLGGQRLPPALRPYSPTRGRGEPTASPVLHNQTFDDRLLRPASPSTIRSVTPTPLDDILAQTLR